MQQDQNSNTGNSPTQTESGAGSGEQAKSTQDGASTNTQGQAGGAEQASSSGESEKAHQQQGGASQQSRTEEFKVSGESLLQKIKDLLRQGNIRRIIIKGEDGKTLVELPLTIGLVGAAIAPVLAAVGAIAALVANCTIVVERRE